MQTGQIIQEARALAKDFVGRGRDEVRLPVFTFEDWRHIYGRPSDGPSLDAFRTQTRKSWYLFRFLRDMNVLVNPVPVRASEFYDHAGEGDHDLSDGHELAHAVGDYVNDPNTPVTNCRHSETIADLMASTGDTLATITTFGETPEAPEVLAVVLHKSDGSVITSKEVLGAENTPEEAWNQITAFLDKYKPGKVFHDQTVRRPEFCGDCNALLVNVASPTEVNCAN